MVDEMERRAAPPSYPLTLSIHWLWGRAGSSLTLPVDGDATLVVGSDPSCDVWLGADPSARPRHALLRCRSGVLEWIDLAPGGSRSAAHIAGAHARYVGKHIVRISSSAANQLQSPIHVRTAANMGQPAIDREQGWSLSLDGHGHTARLCLYRSQLAAGVVLGRREGDAINPMQHDPRISRSHVLIRLEDGELRGFDLRSTNGTFRNRIPTSVFVLAPDGPGVRLGRKDGVELRCVGFTQ